MTVVKLKPVSELEMSFALDGSINSSVSYTPYCTSSVE